MLLAAPSERKVERAAPEDATLVLERFAPIAWLSFGDVAPGDSAVTSLHVANPSKVQAHVTVEQFPTGKGAPHTATALAQSAFAASRHAHQRQSLTQTSANLGL